MSLHSNITRFLSATLALIVLVATVGVALDFHICQGKIKSIGIFEKAISCSNMDSNASCDSPIKTQKDGFSQEPCCKNNQLNCKLNIENTDQVILKFNTQKLLSFEIEINTLRNLIIPNNSVQAIPLLRPPPIEKDFSVLFQSFLI